MTDTLYVMDTSAFLQGWARDYPIGTFKSLWDNLATLAKANRLLFPEDVLKELEKHDDGAKDWIRQFPDCLVRVDELIIAHLKIVMGKHPKLVNTQKGRSGADPLVIATAIARRGAVVTCEKASGNLDKPKIPDVCRDLGVAYLDLLKLVHTENWTF